MKRRETELAGSLYDEALGELLRQLGTTEKEKEQKRDNSTLIDRLPLQQFVENTSKLIMEPWQVDLCERLQTLAVTTGRRILCHKPPQHGGSVIVSQRLPAWVVGGEPNLRVKVSCYNISHATGFTAINKAIMLSAEYAGMFEDDMYDLYIPQRASDEKFFTRKRRNYKDSQA